MKKIYFILLLIINQFCFSQNSKFKDNFLYGASIGYTNQSGNFGKIGIFGEYAFGKYETNMIKVDVNANITGMRNQMNVIPEIGATLYLIHSKTGFGGIFIETELTPYTFTPKAGLTLFTFFDFGFGYGIEIDQKKEFKPINGLQFTFGINVPFNFNIY